MTRAASPPQRGRDGGARRGARWTAVGAEPRSRVERWAPACLALGVVALNVAYAWVSGPRLDTLTVATVLVFFTASTLHALLWRGIGWTLAMLAVTAGGGFAVEVLGVATGWPFGGYTYTDALGWALLGVPVVIPLAWAMMAYPSYVAGRRIAAAFGLGPVAGVLAAAWALTSWDLFLDPQKVAAGHWTWAGGGPALLGIPVTNFLGWFLTAAAMMALLWRLRAAATRGDEAVDDRVPVALYLWVYASSVLAHAVFFGLPASALVGGVGMGVAAVALVAALRRRPLPR